MDIRVAAYAVIVDDRGMLLSHWNEGGYSGWTLPGGGIDPGEDLIIGIGTRYTDFTTSSKSLFKHADVKFLNLNISPCDVLKLDAVQVLADAQTALGALADALGDYRSGWGEEVREAKAQLEAEVDRVHQVEYDGDGFVPEVDDHLDRTVLREFIELTGSCLTQSRVLGVLNETLADDAIIVAAAGSLPGDLQRAWRSTWTSTPWCSPVPQKSPSNC